MKYYFSCNRNMSSKATQVYKLEARTANISFKIGINKEISI